MDDLEEKGYQYYDDIKGVKTGLLAWSSKTTYRPWIARLTYRREDITCMSESTSSTNTSTTNRDYPLSNFFASSSSPSSSFPSDERGKHSTYLSQLNLVCNS